MCKADYVHCVKEIISIFGRARVPWQASPYSVEIDSQCWAMQDKCAPAALRPKHVAISLFWYIIYITDELCQRCQTSPSPPTGCLAPPPRSGLCRSVSGQQFLRSRRFDPGQIRDAAARPDIPRASDPGSAD